jgi:antitoxin component of MazEF toxin-antitoxin module
MATMTLSAKRQVVLPADLCRQISLAPGAQVQVDLSPDGCSIMIQPAANTLKKPVSVLLGRVKHHGKPVSIEEMQGGAVAQAMAKVGSL